jgi:hypothetical protein
MDSGWIPVSPDLFDRFRRIPPQSGHFGRFSLPFLSDAQLPFRTVAPRSSHRVCHSKEESRTTGPAYTRLRKNREASEKHQCLSRQKPRRNPSGCLRICTTKNRTQCPVVCYTRHRELSADGITLHFLQFPQSHQCWGQRPFFVPRLLRTNTTSHNQGTGIGDKKVLLWILVGSGVARS